MINPTFFSRSLKGRCCGNRVFAIFRANRRKLAYPPSFCALAFHNGLEYRDVDERLNIIDDRSTSDKTISLATTTEEPRDALC